MYKGELTLIGGITNGARDQYDYNGIVKNDLTFIARGSREEIREKLRRALQEVKGIAFSGASEEYAREVKGLPKLVAAKLDEDSFRMRLNYDDYDDLIAGAQWQIGIDDDCDVIVLQ